MVEIRTHFVQALVPIPTKRTWGEAWWTARDICLTNIVDPHDEVLADMARELQQREWDAFFYGVPLSPRDN